jgi:hypothetical protein
MIERSQSLRTRKLNHKFISIVNILDVLELEKLLYLAVRKYLGSKCAMT